MWRLLLLCCCARALTALAADGSQDSSPPVKMTENGGEMQPTAEPLEEELDNQENIISQLLNDYDKVKTVSSGSDCVCRCVVRPIKRSECSRIGERDSPSLSQDFYSVETITKGTDCKKCECMAPPSAVNPCEGEYRFKKLQEASKDDIKLATIIDLLEGSLYGIDLLKLNSVTTKLLTRVDNLEKVFRPNVTERSKDKDRMKERPKEKDKKAQQKKKKMSDLEHSGPKSGTAANTDKQKNIEGKKNQQLDGLEIQQEIRNETRVQKPVKDKNTVLVKGVTFYKTEDGIYKEEEERKKGKAKNTILAKNATEDLLISERQQLPRSPELSVTIHKQTTHTHHVKTQSNSSPKPQPIPTTKPADDLNSAVPEVSSPQTATTTIQPSLSVWLQTIASSSTNISPPTAAAATAPPQSKSRSRLSWTESPADQPKPTKKPGVCKDTVASISEPVQKHSYGLRDGTWMRDARGHGNVIYLTNGHYGNILLEFRDMESFKSGQKSNSYNLPYSFTGTGHTVFNGAFYYNRAFSRDVIRYDLRHRLVSAWTTLHDALLEEEAHKTQTEVEFAVDELGLWLLYPALDTEGFHQEVILLIRLHPRDLQPIQTFRTGLRRGRYGNTFLVCGVLYAVDSMERHFANVTYAFDTHTLTHTVPSLAFTNMHTHTSQLDYCPLDKKLYAWDNGHQMMYDVIFAY
ncbi:olfactomedin-like protein 2B isoform X1 [Oryzias latipes]|uniref:Olfactomedin-like 2Bb n=1 Tax=Oryzias latipes TaxID=8090 RepID=H2MFJ9_ORYLA|nr:olfactomedin-like protein 2B isoform X1 [Oryzias latipes]